jgi:hypothetical protein
MVDKYLCSKNASGAGFIASSIKNALALSTHADHNPIADLTAVANNYNSEVITAAHARDGVDGAVNVSSIFFSCSRQIWSALALIATAHGQASTSATNCAWYDATYNYPKGCNDDALGDVDDGAISYTADGYLNSAKTGSGTPFAKTSHNGQDCGVVDMNGVANEMTIGVASITTVTAPEAISRANPAVVTWTGHGGSTGDIAVLYSTNQAGGWSALSSGQKIYTITKVDNDNFSLDGTDSSGFTEAYIPASNPSAEVRIGYSYMVNESVAMKSITGGDTEATDHFSSAGIAALMTKFTPVFETTYPVNTYVQYCGSGSAQFLSEATSGNNWLLTSIVAPYQADAIDLTGTDAFGKDRFWQYYNEGISLNSSGGTWDTGSGAGIFTQGWNTRAVVTGNTRHGFRCACYLDI